MEFPPSRKMSNSNFFPTHHMRERERSDTTTPRPELISCENLCVSDWKLIGGIFSISFLVTAFGIMKKRFQMILHIARRRRRHETDVGHPINNSSRLIQFSSCRSQHMCTISLLSSAWLETDQIFFLNTIISLFRRRVVFVVVGGISRHLKEKKLKFSRF